jgi:hypothetical protein
MRGKVIGQGQDACIVSDPDDDSQVIKIYVSMPDKIYQQISISAELLKIDPMQHRYVAPSDFRRVSIDEVKNLEGVTDFLGDLNPAKVWTSKMKLLTYPPERFAPLEREHLEDSVRLLNKTIQHGDIHRQNIMMNGPYPVLIDFGRARFSKADEVDKMQDVYLQMMDEEQRLKRRVAKKPRIE